MFPPPALLKKDDPVVCFDCGLRKPMFANILDGAVTKKTVEYTAVLAQPPIRHLWAQEAEVRQTSVAGVRVRPLWVLEAPEAHEN